MVRVIKAARIRWLGHLVRMEENSPCKKVTFSQPEGSQKKGRSKLRWLDSVLKDVKLLKVEAWWKKALHMNIWGRIIKQVKVCRARRRRRRIPFLSPRFHSCLFHCYHSLSVPFMKTCVKVD
jgi:hypothetical protein